LWAVLTGTRTDAPVAADPGLKDSAAAAATELGEH
jgi:hypothetical protein